MSAFLGPVHFWLYKKIQLQEGLIDAIGTYAVKNGWLTADEVKAYETAERRDLAEAVDGSNIHGWLQNRIHDSEGRLADLVTTLTAADTVRFADLKEVACNFGKAAVTEVPVTAPEAFHLLDDTLLNGMPCDQVMKVVESTPDTVIWEETQDLHGEFWNGKGDCYYKLRSALIKGLLSGSTFKLKSLSGRQYEISK